MKFLRIFFSSYFSTGIGFNIASINVLITEFTDFTYILPFVLGTPVSIFWTFLCIFLPMFKKDFYSQFAFMPIAIYDRSFYDGLGFDPNDTSIHPFAKQFIKEDSFFEKTLLILMIFLISGSKLKEISFLKVFFRNLIKSKEIQNLIIFSTFSVAQILFWIYSCAFYLKLKSESKQQVEESSKDL